MNKVFTKAIIVFSILGIVFIILVLSTQFCSVRNIDIEVSSNNLNNTIGNVINGGRMAVQDDWIYYINPADGWSLYKMNLRGKNNTKISDHVVNSFNILDKYIYFSINVKNDFSDYSLCRIRTDGSDFKILNYDIVEQINVSKEWIYYINKGDNMKLYKVRVDGSNKTKLSDDMVLYLSVDNDIVYYAKLDLRDTDQNGRVYSIENDGSNKKDLLIRTISQINVVDKTIYFGQEDGLYKLQLADSVNIKLNKISSIIPYGINVCGKKIYFTNSKKTSLYSSSTDCEGEHKICNASSIDNFYVANDWLFFYEGSKSRVRVVNSDGSKMQTFIKQ